MSGDQYNLDLVIRLPGGGGDGMGSQHSQSLESFFMCIPGIKLVIPSNAYNAKGLMIISINLGEPVFFFKKTWKDNQTGQLNINVGFIEATQIAIVHSPYFRNHYEQIKRRVGTSSAIIATARRLLEIIYLVWTQKRNYYEINRNRALAVALT